MNNTQASNKSRDIYTIVTDRIIKHLENGVVPWKQPWSKSGLPKNLISQRQYRGINVWLLASLHHSQNYFLTFKQVKELGGSVKQGEKSCPVIYWNWVEKENKETGKKEQVPFLRYYNVFNISQCEGIPKEKVPPVVERKNDPIKSCEEIIAGMPKRPDVRHKEHRAYYNPKEDFVNMPEAKTFIDSESYYATLFHELVHSTGHQERLNRKEIMEMKGMYSEDYAIEELTAEMGASYLKSFSGISIEKVENNAAYIEHWLGRLKKDKRFIVYASARAQQATDYILNTHVKEQENSLDMEELPDNFKVRKSQLEKLRRERPVEPISQTR
jgi:antirestriction protein ArdC